MQMRPTSSTSTPRVHPNQSKSPASTLPPTVMDSPHPCTTRTEVSRSLTVTEFSRDLSCSNAALWSGQQPERFKAYADQLQRFLDNGLLAARQPSEHENTTQDSQHGTASESATEPEATTVCMGEPELEVWKSYTMRIAEAIGLQEDVEDQCALALMFLSQVLESVGVPQGSPGQETDRVIATIILPRLRGAKFEYVRGIFTSALTTQEKRDNAERIQREYELKCLGAFMDSYTRKSRKARRKARPQDGNVKRGEASLVK